MPLSMLKTESLIMQPSQCGTGAAMQTSYGKPRPSTEVKDLGCLSQYYGAHISCLNYGGLILALSHFFQGVMHTGCAKWEKMALLV